MGRKDEGVGGWFAGPRFWRIAAPAILLISLFSEAIYQTCEFAYRDAAHFYYPLYERIQSTLAAGRLPLWDPCENLGQPLLANPTSAVFYPGKAIFFLPALLPVSYGFCFKWYVLGHIALAFFTFYRLGRRFGSARAALFGALSYAFGGSVLFQYTNVIFLVGAAWLPLILLAGIRLLETGSGRSAAFLAVALALCVFGGDPQTAYLGGVLLAILFLCHRQSVVSLDSAGDAKPVSFARRFRLLLLAGGFAASLGAAQILPSVELARHSNRLGAIPMSIWEMPFVRSGAAENTAKSAADETAVDVESPLGERVGDGILCRRIAETGRVNRIYLFSLPPWRFFELIWPNVGGKIFPENSRWIAALPNGRHEWIGTVYFGLFPLLAVTLAAKWLPTRRFTGRKGNERQFYRLFFTWFALLAALGATGGFGPVWFVRWFSDSGARTTFDSFQNGDPVGGVYWLFTQILPGFASFRYPAKLMTSALLGFSMLAVFGFEPLVRGRLFRRRRFFLLYAGLLAVSLVLAAFFYSGRGVDCLERLIGTACGSTPYGPCDWTAAGRTLFFSFAQTAVLLAAFGGLAAAGIIRRVPKRRLGTVLIAVLCVDLYAAQRWTVSTVPEQCFGGRFDSILTAESSPDTDSSGNPPLRFYRHPRLAAPDFLARRSKNRPAELVGWQRATLLSQFAAEADCANLSATGTMTPNDYAPVKRYLWDADGKSDSVGARENLLAFLGCGALLLPDTETPDRAKAICAASASGGSERCPNGTAIWRLSDVGARVRIFHRTFSDETIERAFAEREKEPPRAGEEARLTRYEPEKITLEATLLEPGHLLLTEQYWPGWRATAVPVVDGEADESERRSVAVQKDCVCLRRIDLDAGTWRVEMSYRPKPVPVGIGISSLAWIGLAVYLCGFPLKRRRAPSPTREFRSRAEASDRCRPAR